MRIPKVFEKIWKTLNEVSTPPNKTSYYWKESFSLLSWIILKTLFWARCFSLLQWIKYFVRKEKKKDDESKRPNVPSIVVELYYLVLSLGFLCIVRWQHCFSPYWYVTVKVAAIYFLVDSIIWVLYYFFFRRFFEEKYAIMHTLEYIVTFPLVIILQACCLNISTGICTTRLAAMLINPDAGTPLPILAISVIYTAVILGLIISNLPTENIKEKGDYRYHLLVLGYGEVVKGRLLQAIATYSGREKEYKNVVIYDYGFSENDDSKKVKIPSNLDLHKYELKVNDKDEMELFHKRVLASNILWIATPPISHLQYVESYYNKLKMIVVEKPITVFRNELDLFRMIHSKVNNIFCLSYYYLEKALPLTYLYRPLCFYEEYLNISDDNRKSIIPSLYQLGQLKSISFYIHEKAETEGRKWTYDEQTGGQLFETFIHLLVLARLVLGEQLPHHTLRWKDNHKTSDRITQITATGNIKGVKILLEMKKELPESEIKRGCELIYQKGKINVDFENIQLKMASEQQEFELELDKNYKNTKYSIQLDMVSRCLKDHINPSTVDGSDLQMECLQWLMDEKIFS